MPCTVANDDANLRQARTVIRNALFFGGAKWSSQLLPWATYTEPEIAHVGAYDHELEVRMVCRRCRRVFERTSHRARDMLSG